MLQALIKNRSKRDADKKKAAIFVRLSLACHSGLNVSLISIGFKA